MIWKRREKRSPLDEPLMYWNLDKRWPYTIRHHLNGGLLIMGQTGSAKTSSSGRTVAEALVGHPRSGGLILAAKPEDEAFWRGVFARKKRTADLTVLQADGETRFNLIDYVTQMGGDAREITKCIMTIAETLQSTSNKGGENADFFEGQQKRVIQSAAGMLRLGLGRVTAPELQRFINTAALNSAELTSETWKKELHNQVIAAAHRRQKTSIEQHDFELWMDFWCFEYPNMAERTRSSILTGVMGVLDIFNTGIVREICSTTTNWCPDRLCDAQWMMVNMAPTDWGDTGRFVCGAFKYLTQQRILKRQADEGDVFVTIVADESHQFINRFDTTFLAMCRSHLGAQVYTSQSVASFYGERPGDDGKHQVNSLLANFGHKIMHALGDHETAEFGSNLIGRRLQRYVGGNVAPVQSLWDEMVGVNRFGGSFSEHMENIVEPRVFMTGLRTGGPANNYMADAIVIKSGNPFPNGENFALVSFSQR